MPAICGSRLGSPAHLPMWLARVVGATADHVFLPVSGRFVKVATADIVVTLTSRSLPSDSVGQVTNGRRLEGLRRTDSVDAEGV